MARYRTERVGVFDTVAGALLKPASGQPWLDYLEWLSAGNTPDPYVPPAEPAETLAQAKTRKIAAIKREGMLRIQNRFPAVVNFDTLQLLKEFWLSIAPAARSPTTDWQWAIDTYQAGMTAVGQVNAAATIPAVDAVTATWPS